MAKRDEGVYIVCASGMIVPESSELRALRLAVEHGGTVQFVKFGANIHEEPAGLKDSSPTTDSMGLPEENSESDPSEF